MPFAQSEASADCAETGIPPSLRILQNGRSGPVRLADSVAVLVAMWLCAASVAAVEKDRPNVLFIAVDDLRPILGCHGHPMVKSPNMDRLAGEGLLFNRAYCQAALCMPSRSSLLSGYRPETLRNKAGPLMGKAPAGTVTLPRLFRDAGYTTVSVGKIYHYNDDDPEGWVRRHMDTFAESGQYCHGYCAGYQSTENLERLPNYFRPRRGPTAALPRPSTSECLERSDEECPDGVIARRAIEELREFAARGEPFFLAVGFYRPHMPWTAPKRYWDLYDREGVRLPVDFQGPDDGIPRGDWDEVRRYGDIPEQGQVSEAKAREMIHAYYASVSFVDAQIGKVLDELRRLGLERNTVILLWSDNGWNLGDHNRWSKPTNFETCARITMMLSVPGMPRKQKTDALVELIDIYPSLCDLCHIPAPGYLEGTSFAPLLLSPGRPWKSAAFTCLIDYATLSIRTDRFRLIRHARGQLELYDHDNDPGERSNLASDPSSQAVVQGLQKALSAGWRSARPGLGGAARGAF